MRVERALLEELPEKKFNIGYQGEQNHTQVIISCPIMFRDYPDAVASMVVKPPQGDLYPVSLTRDGNDLTWDVSDADVAIPGEGILQLTFTDGESDTAEIIKTVYGSYSVNASLVANGEAPDPVQSWLDEAGAALETFENEIGDIRKITTATEEDEGLALSPKTVVNGKVVEWEYIDLADPEVVTQAIDDWLDDHPEATTTVQDGAITEAKLNDSLKADLAWKDDVDGLMSAIDYEISPITPTSYYTMPNTGKELNWQGNLVDNAVVDSSDYIEINDGLYDICKIVTNKTKYGLGSICYYNASKVFVRRDLPGTNYEFSIYNGETVVWFNIDKTTAGIKYVRFCSENNKGFKYWVVEQGPQATILDEYSKLSQYGKKIVNFGDSIFGQTRPPKDVSSYLATKTGATVYNCGFGGCEMSRHTETNYDPFSMYQLADAIATNTWTAQETAAAASGMPSYFAETVALLKTIDFSKVDIITIAYGTNDFNNSSPLDNGGKSDMTGFADALRYSIETLLDAFPNLRIFLCTPIYRFWMDGSYQFVDDSDTHVNPTTNKKLTDFVDKTIEVGEEYHLPVINNYEIGMNKYNRSYYFYSTDGTHPKPEGNELIADNIANKIY